MNNEPVAWVEEDNINMSGYQFDFQFVAFSHKPKSEADWIPLYTQPSEHDLGIAEAIGFDKGYKAATAKTLTDEEINEIFSKTWLDLKDYKDFARAILKKAQEK
jgi:hypothetical protein